VKPESPGNLARIDKARDPATGASGRPATRCRGTTLSVVRTIFLPVLLATSAVPAGFAQEFTDGGWTYTLHGSNEATVISYDGPVGAVVVPASVGGYAVKVVGGGLSPVVDGTENFTSVTIPEGVTTIANLAFAGVGVASVALPHSLRSIGDAAFFRCISLATVKIPDSVTTIGVAAFAGCSALTSATIGNGVTRIREGAFLNCPALTSVLFTGAPPTLENDAFFNVSPDVVAYYLPSSAGWDSTLGNLPVQPFIPTARESRFTPAAGFHFSWTGTGSIPMNVRRAPSLGGAWTIVSTNNPTGQFTDPGPPSGQAFYQACLP